MLRFLLKIVLISLILSSCRFPVPQKFRKEFDCYRDGYRGLDTLINTHGFYTKMNINDNTGNYGMKEGKFQRLGIDTSYYSFMFFNDGIFIDDIGSAGLTVSEYLKQKANKGESAFGQLQGTYTLSGGIIKVKSVSYGFPNNVWYGYEVWYKIIDKNTIVDFYIRHLALPLSDRNKEDYKPRLYSDSNPSKFVYVDKMPKSSSWLKKEEWFYCK